MSGTVRNGEEGTQPVTDGTQPVNLDTRLTYTEPSGKANPNNSLYYCYNFKVTNSSNEPVEWEVTFDTTKAPLWGMNPTRIAANTPGALSSLWGGVTDNYNPENGYWTIKGESYNRTLQPGGEAQVGYCAQANIPEADPSTFSTEIAFSSGSNTYNAELAVRVTSTSSYFVPWEIEVDLADYACVNTLPSTITGVDGNSTLTRIEGTRYILRGVIATDTRFVSSSRPRDFVFFRWNPGGQEYRAGNCA